MSVMVLAEKPSQAKAYADAFSGTKKREGYYEVPSCSQFPDGAKITYAIGHLVTLKEPHEYQEEWGKWELNTLPIVPNSFQFKVPPDKTKQFNVVKKILKESSEVVIATDCDREGENIARSILSLAGGNSKPTKRLWINSLEVEEVKKGFSNLKDGNEYIPFYDEAQARQVSDWLVGLNFSRAYTLLLRDKGINEVFSVGRVQTPTLRLIYDRHKEIKEFIPKPFYELEALFNATNGKYIGKYKERFNNKAEIVNTLFNKHQISPPTINGRIVQVLKEVKSTKAPKLHSLSSLQTLANKKYKYSPSQVLKIVQSLYDSPLKLVTYPRTDTQYITENEFEYLVRNLKGYQNVVGNVFEAHSLEPNKNYVNGSKVQEHYAIVPTKNIPNEAVLNALTVEQKKIYFEIVKSVLAIFHKPYKYEETLIETDVNGLVFETKGKVELEKGWKELFANEVINNEKENESILPNVQKDSLVKGILEIKDGITKPPKPFTEGQLINLMKTCGKSLKDMDEEEQSILKEVEGLGTEATRGGIIDTLKKQNYIEVRKNIVYVTPKGEILCKVVDGTLLAKPELTAKWEGYLKKIGRKEGDKRVFIGNTIKFTKELIEVTKKKVKETNIDTNITDLAKDEFISKCPSCKKGHIVHFQKKDFYGCTEFKTGCKQTFPKKILEKTLTKNNIKQLCEKGKTNKIKGFKGKKEFDSYLILKDGKISFSFN